MVGLKYANYACVADMHRNACDGETAQYLVFGYFSTLGVEIREKRELHGTNLLHTGRICYIRDESAAGGVKRAKSIYRRRGARSLVRYPHHDADTAAPWYPLRSHTVYLLSCGV